MKQRGSGRVADGSGAEPDGRPASLLPAGEPVGSLLRKAQFFTPGTPSGDYRELHRRGGRGAEEFYRERWRHDKEVRSTHGVNCTGSCSWKVFVKDGIITWETQQTDWVIWGLWPFSRLVHAWSYPVWYLWRPYVVFRSRIPAPPGEPGTGGRKWRKIGVPY